MEQTAGTETVPRSSSPPPYTETPSASAVPPPYSLTPTTLPPRYGQNQVMYNIDEPLPTTRQPGTSVHIISADPTFGMNEGRTFCHVCHVTVIPTVNHETSCATHVLACFLCAAGFWICVPYVYLLDCLPVTYKACPVCSSRLA